MDNTVTIFERETPNYNYFEAKRGDQVFAASTMFSKDNLQQRRACLRQMRRALAELGWQKVRVVLFKEVEDNTESEDYETLWNSLRDQLEVSVRGYDLIRKWGFITDREEATCKAFEEVLRWMDNPDLILIHLPFLEQKDGQT